MLWISKIKFQRSNSPDQKYRRHLCFLTCYGLKSLRAFLKSINIWAEQPSISLLNRGYSRSEATLSILTVWCFHCSVMKCLPILKQCCGGTLRRGLFYCWRLLQLSLWLTSSSKLRPTPICSVPSIFLFCNEQPQHNERKLIYTRQCTHFFFLGNIWYNVAHAAQAHVEAH